MTGYENGRRANRTAACAFYLAWVTTVASAIASLIVIVNAFVVTATFTPWGRTLVVLFACFLDFFLRLWMVQRITPLSNDGHDNADFYDTKFMTVFSACSVGFSMVAFLATVFFPYHKSVHDPFHYGRLITYQCHYDLTALDVTGLNVLDMLNPRTRPSTMCLSAQLTSYGSIVVLTCDFLSTFVLALLSSEKSGFARSILVGGRNAESQELSRSHEQESPRLEENAGRPLDNQTAGIELSDISLPSRAVLNMERPLDHMRATEPPSPRIATVTRRSRSRESSASNDSSLYVPPLVYREERRSRSTLLSERPDQPNPALRRGRHHRAQRRLTPTTEVGSAPRSGRNMAHTTPCIQQ